MLRSFSDDKLDRFFIVIKFWMDATSGLALELKSGVPTYQVEDEEGRTHSLIHVPIEEEDENRWCLWRPDHAGFDLSVRSHNWHGFRHGPEGCDENGPAAVRQLPDRSRINLDMLRSSRPAAAGPAAHFDRNESHVSYRTGHWVDLWGCAGREIDRHRGNNGSKIRLERVLEAARYPNTQLVSVRPAVT